MRGMKLSNIRAKLEGDRILLEAPEFSWLLEKYGDLEEIWEGMGEDDPDERIPYWTELWPSSLALAQWLAARREEIRDRICLDLGCGLGFTALLGQKLGGRVLAVDYEPSALEYCGKNAVLNGVNPPWRLAMDWRAPALKQNSVYRIWAGDIIYEKRFITPVLEFLDYALEKDGLAWIAEPGRNIFYSFKDKAEEKGFVMEKRFSSKVPDLHNEKALLEATVWEVKRLGYIV